MFYLQLTFANKGSAGPVHVSLTPNFPAKVVPVDLSTTNGGLITKTSAYMASFGKVDIDYSCDCDFLRCCCGGMGLVRQKLKGTGTTFLAAGGTIIQKELAAGEQILVDHTSVLAWSDSVDFKIK